MQTKKHRPGDGLHYVSEQFVVFPDGSFQEGGTSEPCILRNVAVLLESHHLPDLHLLWNSCYPDDPMCPADVADLITLAAPFTHPFQPERAADITGAIADLEAIGCSALANLILRLLPDAPEYA